MKKLLSLIFGIVLFLPLTAGAAEPSENCRLEQVLMVSRHNIRAPLAGRDSVLAQITRHSWFPWRVAAGELSMRGGEMETLMGQYVRERLERDGLFAPNTIPVPREIRFYANSFQRTIATARYFSAGMFPVADVPVEHHFAVNEPDPVFLSGLTDAGDHFLAQAMTEFEAAGGGEAVCRQAERGCRVLAKVLDFEESPYAAEHDGTGFSPDSFELCLENGYDIKNSFMPACKASDALTLQYYEEDNPVRAAFGHSLTWEEWQTAASVKELGVNLLFRLPTVSKALSAPLLEVAGEELSSKGRKFTFLCGHDVNLAAILSALEAEDYVLPDSIEAKTPIGAKLVIEKRRGADGREYAAIYLLYPTARQLRQREMLSLAHPPAVVPIELRGLIKRENGYYLFDDLMCRMEASVQAGKGYPSEG